MKGTFLLKWLATFCVLDVGATLNSTDELEARTHQRLCDKGPGSRVEKC